MLIKEGRSWSGHEKNCCFLNTGNGQFADISAVSGFDFADDGRALATVDWDRDGDLDVWVSNRNAPRLRFLRNETPAGNHFLFVRLVGNGTTTSRDAIGARVEVVLKGQKSEVGSQRSEAESQNFEVRHQNEQDPGSDSPEEQPEPADQHPASRIRLIKTLRAGEGFLAQSSKWMHFGLGAAKSIDKVIVRWPAGPVETFAPWDVDGHYELLQGTGKPRVVGPIANKLKVSPGGPQVPATSERARVPLVTLLKVPKVSYRKWDGTQQALPVGSGKPVLLNLWASWCQPCMVELASIAKKEKEIRAKDVQVIALSVDGLSGPQSNPDNAPEVIQRNGFPFPSGYATPDLLTLLQTMHDNVLQMQRPLPIPTSFLIDEQGRLAVIYKGPMSVKDVLADVNHASGDREERFIDYAGLSGSIVRHDRIAGTLETAELNVRLNFAQSLTDSGRLDDAAQACAEILNIVPNFAEAFSKRGNVYQKLGKHELALSDLSNAIELKPDLAEAYFNRAITYNRLGKRELALSDFSKAIELKPDDTEPYNNRGLMYHRLGKYDLAHKDFTRAIALKADYADAYYNRGLAYQQLGDYQLALVDYAKAVELKPEYAQAYNNQGNVYQQLGKYELARASYTRAIALRPNHMGTYNNRGLANQQLGNDRLALDDYAKAIELNPRDPRAYNLLAWLLATCPDAQYRDGEKAVSNARRACELLRWKHWNTLEVLAAAFAEDGQFTEAVKWQTKALELAPPGAKPQLRSRLERFAAGSPYRQEAKK